MGYSVRIESALTLPEPSRDAATILAILRALDKQSGLCFEWQYERDTYMLVMEEEHSYWEEEFQSDLRCAYGWGFRGPVIFIGEDGEKWMFVLDEDGISEWVGVVTYEPKRDGYRWKLTSSEPRSI